MDAQFLLFLGISAAVIITPGQDTALTVRNSLAGGKTVGISTAFGVTAGQLLWAVSAAVGLVAILAAAETLFTAIKYAGAAYLIYLGLQSLWIALCDKKSNAHGHAAYASGLLTRRKALVQGIVSNLGNPKMAIFFASLLPQFVPPGAPTFVTMMALGVVFCTMTLLWLCFYAYVVTWAGNVLQTPRVRRVVDGIAGLALVGIGIRVSLMDR